MRSAALALVAAVLACGPQQDPRRAARHLILVTVDTLRADRLGIYGNPLGLTPHLDALAEEGIVFRHAFAPAPFTLASLSAILTGDYPGRTRRAEQPSRGAILGRHAILRDGHQYVVIRRRNGGRARKVPTEVLQDLSQHERARLEALGYIFDEGP